MSVASRLVGQALSHGAVQQVATKVAGAAEGRAGQAAARAMAGDGLKLSAAVLARLDGAQVNLVATSAFDQMARVPGYQRQAALGYEALEAIIKMTDSPVARFAHEAARTAPNWEGAAKVLASALENPNGLAAGLTADRAAVAVADIGLATVWREPGTKTAINTADRAMETITDLVPHPVIDYLYRSATSTSGAPIVEQGLLVEALQKVKGLFS